jgi:hypothetical protein
MKHDIIPSERNKNEKNKYLNNSILEIKIIFNKNIL